MWGRYLGRTFWKSTFCTSRKAGKKAETSCRASRKRVMHGQDGSVGSRCLSGYRGAVLQHTSCSSLPPTCCWRHSSAAESRMALGVGLLVGEAVADKSGIARLARPDEVQVDVGSDITTDGEA